MKRNLLFVSSAIQQPRHQRRISILNRLFCVSVLYSVRDAYQKNIKDLNVKSKNLGCITRRNGKLNYLLSRLRINLKTWWLFLTKERDSLLYLTAPDQALLSILSFRKFFIEYGDIQALSYQSRISKLIDWIICRNASGVIVTSPAYYSKYFMALGLDRKKVCVAENKLPRSVATSLISSSAITNYDTCESIETNSSSQDNKRVRLGLIGALNRFEIYEIYRNIIKKNSNLTLEVFGDIGSNDSFYGEERVSFYGSYRNPEDLQRIYNSVDIVLINYDAKDSNVQIALPNKLYEAMFFRKPIICTNDTYLAEVVAEKGIGFSCDLNEFAIESAILRCVAEDFSTAWKRLDSKDYISDNLHIAHFVNQHYN